MNIANTACLWLTPGIYVDSYIWSAISLQGTEENHQCSLQKLVAPIRGDEMRDEEMLRGMIGPV